MFVFWNVEGSVCLALLKIQLEGETFFHTSQLRAVTNSLSKWSIGCFSIQSLYKNWFNLYLTAFLMVLLSSLCTTHIWTHPLHNQGCLFPWELKEKLWISVKKLAWCILVFHWAKNAFSSFLTLGTGPLVPWSKSKCWLQLLWKPKLKSSFWQVNLLKG